MSREYTHVSTTIRADSRVDVSDREHPVEGVPRIVCIGWGDISIAFSGDTDEERVAALSLVIAAATTLKRSALERIASRPRIFEGMEALEGIDQYQVESR